MNSISDILNIISNFTFKTKDNKNISLTGILQQENGNIILNARSLIKNLTHLNEDNFIIYGTISATKITLLGCRISKKSFPRNSKYFYTIIIPSEIIIGGKFEQIPDVIKISCEIESLYSMFSESPLQENYQDDTIHHNVVLYSSFPDPIEASDKYGKIQLFQGYSFCNPSNSYEYRIIPEVIYSFNHSISLHESIARISRARILFSFFGNRFIPFGELSFFIKKIKEPFGLWLNYSENIAPNNEPFLIRTSHFKNEFQKIWNSWISLFETATPIPLLYYEIITERSIGINSFLNLTQTLEIFSERMRNEFAWEYAHKNNYNKQGNLPLKYRLMDIVNLNNFLFNFDEDLLCKFAKSLADMRNFYTHYNDLKYIESTYDELSAAIQILKLILLFLIYTSLDLSKNIILDCTHRVAFRDIDYNIEIIFQYDRRVNRIKNVSK